MPTSITTDARVARVIAAFESLQPGDVAGLAALYTEDARFKDPFNDVQGHAALRRVFEHMFVALDGPRFVVTEAIVQGDRCFLVWSSAASTRMRRWPRCPTRPPPLRGCLGFSLAGFCPGLSCDGGCEKFPDG